MPGGLGLPSAGERTIVEGRVPGFWSAREQVTYFSADRSANLIVTNHPVVPPMDTAGFAAANDPGRHHGFPGHVEHSLGDRTVLGRHGIERVFSWQAPDGRPVTQVQAYLVVDGRGFVATGTTLTAGADRARPTFDEMIDALVLIDDPSRGAVPRHPLERARHVGGENVTALGGGGASVRYHATTMELDQVIAHYIAERGQPEERSATSARWRHHGDGSTAFVDVFAPGSGGGPGFQSSLVPPDAKAIVALGHVTDPAPQPPPQRRRWRRGPAGRPAEPVAAPFPKALGPMLSEELGGRLCTPVPDGWTVEEKVTMEHVSSHIVVSSSPIDPAFDSLRFALRAADEIRQGSPAYREHTFEPRRAFERDGYLHRFSWSPPGWSPVTQVKLYAAGGGRSVTATATCAMDAIESGLEELLRTLDGLTIAGLASDRDQPA